MQTTTHNQIKALEHLRYTMKYDPTKIIDTWKMFSQTKITYSYEKAVQHDEIKTLCKIEILKDNETEKFFFTCIGHKSCVRNTMLMAKYEASVDLVNYSKLLCSDAKFQSYLLSDDFIIEKKSKRKRTVCDAENMSSATKRRDLKTKDCIIQPHNEELPSNSHTDDLLGMGILNKMECMNISDDEQATDILHKMECITISD